MLVAPLTRRLSVLSTLSLASGGRTKGEANEWGGGRLTYLTLRTLQDSRPVSQSVSQVSKSVRQAGRVGWWDGGSTKTNKHEARTTQHSTIHIQAAR